MDIDATSQWKQLLTELDEENDSDKLHEKVIILEDVLLRCQEALGKHPSRKQERDELESAVKKLYAVKVTKLGFPDPFSQLSK